MGTITRCDIGYEAAALPGVEAILADPHSAGSFKQHLTTPEPFLTGRDDRHNERRRFADQPVCVTGFDSLDSARTIAQRSVDYAEYVRELRDDCRGIDDERVAA